MYSIGEFSKLIKKSVNTLQRWDREGVLSPNHRTPKNRRQYSHQQYLDYFNIGDVTKRKTIIYCRVSSTNQKPDLEKQITFTKQFMFNSGKTFDEIYTDIGSGLNFKRINFNKLINEITDGLVEEVIIAHKDRLVRFGFDLIEMLCKKYNTKLTIINEEKLSPSDEMVKDLISIVHVFSSRLYGLRSYKNKINEICKEDTNRTK